MVKILIFPGATIEDMYHNLVPILEINSCRSILHVAKNNAESFAFISEKCPQCQTIFLTPSIRSDKTKANVMVRQLTNHILQLKTDVVENRDIKDRCIGRKKLQLDFFGTFYKDNFHGLSRNVSGPDFITCQSAEDNFKDTLKKFRIKNLNRVIISQININSIRNKIEFVPEAILRNIEILMVSETKIDISDKSICQSGFSCACYNT